MAPWLIALVFVVVVGGFGWLVDQRARRRRRGLERLSGPYTATDRVAQVERADPGATLRAENAVNRFDTPC